MITTLCNWMAALTAAVALAAVHAVLDGPSDAQIEAAQAADLVQAQEQAALEAKMLERCKVLRGPRAELAMIHGTDDYACRVEEGI